jgi:hypothetical protein
MVQATTEQIRGVADGLYDGFNFALALANCIAVKIAMEQIAKWERLPFAEWPDEPPMPAPV